MNGLIESLPFPKRSFTWFAVIIILIFTFLFYYKFGYTFLKNEYNQKLYPYSYVFELEGTDIETDKEGIVHYDIVVKAPQDVSDFETQWAYIEIENNSNCIGTEELEVYMNSTSNPYIYPDQFLHESYSKNGYLYSSAKFENVFPKMKAYARIPFIIEESAIDKNMTVYINGIEQENKISINYIKEKNLSSLFYSLMNQILLPPWSNGIILLVVIFICYFIEESKVWDDKLNISLNGNIESIKNKIVVFFTEHFSVRSKVFTVVAIITIFILCIIILKARKFIVVYSVLLTAIIVLTFPLKEKIKKFITRTMITVIIGMLLFFLLTGTIVYFIVQHPNLSDNYLYLLKGSLIIILLVYVNNYFGKVNSNSSGQKPIEIQNEKWKFNSKGNNFFLVYDSSGIEPNPENKSTHPNEENPK